MSLEGVFYAFKSIRRPTIPYIRHVAVLARKADMGITGFGLQDMA